MLSKSLISGLKSINKKQSFAPSALSLRLCVFCISAFFFSQNVYSDHSELTEVKTFGDNPGNLKMFYYTPFSSSDTTERALVVVLHGCNQNAKSIAELSGWNKLAKLYNFYILYPEQRRMNNGYNCFNWFLYEDIVKNKGESASVMNMCLYMQKNFSIDKRKVFVTGMSAGGAMTLVMLSGYPGHFRSGAVFAGAAYKSATTISEAMDVAFGKSEKTGDELELAVREENPYFSGTYPSLHIYHGSNDKVVNYKNAFLIAKQWQSLFNNDTLTTDTIHSFASISGLKKISWKNTSGTACIQLYSMEGLGHYYMIKPGEKKNEGGKKGIFSSEKGFHSTWQVALDFGLITE